MLHRPSPYSSPSAANRRSHPGSASSSSSDSGSESEAEPSSILVPASPPTRPSNPHRTKKPVYAFDTDASIVTKASIRPTNRPVYAYNSDINIVTKVPVCPAKQPIHAYDSDTNIVAPVCPTKQPVYAYNSDASTGPGDQSERTASGSKKHNLRVTTACRQQTPLFLPDVDESETDSDNIAILQLDDKQY